MANSEVAKLVREIKTWPGWRLVEGRHYTAYPPDKSIPGITFARTPSDHRWLNNTKARLRRAGAPI